MLAGTSYVATRFHGVLAHPWLNDRTWIQNKHALVPHGEHDKVVESDLTQGGLSKG